MNRESSYGMTARMRASLSDMEELYREVSEGLFLPKRFRKAPFTEEVKKRYLTQLGREIELLKGRILRVERNVTQEGRHE